MAPEVIALEVMAPDVIAEVMAPDVIAPDVIAPDVIAPEVMAPEAGAPPDVIAAEVMAELDVAGALAGALELLLGVELLVVLLLSLPQALTVSVPAANNATRPLIRVIFTQFLRFSCSRNPSTDRPGARYTATHLGR